MSVYGFMIIHMVFISWSWDKLYATTMTDILYIDDCKEYKQDSDERFKTPIAVLND